MTSNPLPSDLESNALSTELYRSRTCVWEGVYSLFWARHIKWMSRITNVIPVAGIAFILRAIPGQITTLFPKCSKLSKNVRQIILRKKIFQKKSPCPPWPKISKII